VASGVVATTSASHARAGAGDIRRLLSDRWVLVTALAGVLWLAAYAAATAAIDGGRGALILSDVVYAVPVAVAAVLTVLAARRASGRYRLFWRLLALSNVSWLAGEVAWATLELGLGRDPFPSIADVFYLGSYAVALPAVLFGFGAGLRTHGLRAVLDASMLAAAVGVSGYVLLIEPQLDYGPSLATFTGIAYPLLGIAVLTLLVSVGYSGRVAVPPPIGIIGIGFGVTALTDACYTYVTVTGSYGAGSWISLGWQLEAVLFCVAAVAVASGRWTEAEANRTPRDHGLPLVLAGMAAAVAIVGVDLVDGRVSVPVALLGAYAVVSVVVRLVLTSREQQRLVAELQTRSRTLSIQARALESTLTQHERAERELDRSVSTLRATLEATADGILVVDRSGRIVGSNRKFLELWRIPEHVMATGDDGLVLRSVLDQLIDPEAFVEQVNELYADPDAESFDTLRFRDGRLFERLSMPQRVGGQSVGRVWSFRDVTDRSRLEHELRHAQKMEAVGRLAGGIAHDFNNLLTAIIGHSDLLLAQLDETPSRRAAEQIKSASERATSLTSQLLAFGRKQFLQPKVVDLNEVVEGMGGLLAPLLGETVELTITAAPEPVPVLVDRGQIEQVVANLVINARDAMPDGGRIEVAAALSPSGRAVLRVRDSGQGMDEATLQKAFEPFFTTKPLGAGTGLGLSTVLGIVEQSGGRVEVDSSPGAGTTVELTLTAAPSLPEPAASSVLEKRTPGPQARGIVLLVEDEEIVRDLLHDVLVDAGHDVLVAADGEEALALSASHDGPIDLMLTDLVMPGISGRELGERIAVLRPAMAIVYMSGYTEDAIVRHGVREAGATFLQKPFTLDEVVGTVGALLAQPTRSAA
jgi:signal transduction histidine kinase/CheY-like chemotaxis protein